MSDEKKEDAYYERRVHELGLPPIPDEYKGGGLALASLANSAAEGRVLARVLEEAGLPSWVIWPARSPEDEGPATGAEADQRAVVVPTDRLSEAKEVLDRAEPQLLEKLQEETKRHRDSGYYERRAMRLGLPTEAEAYQDGGLVEASTAPNLSEAEMLAALLNANGVPAWADAPLSSMYSDGYCRAYIRVLVPMGRLADAKKLIAEHKSGHEEPEELPQEDEGERRTPAGGELREGQGTDKASGKGEPGQVLLTLAMGLLALALLFPFVPKLLILLASPVCFVFSSIVAFMAWCRSKRLSSNRVLRRALLWALLSAAIWGLLLAFCVCITLGIRPAPKTDRVIYLVDPPVQKPASAPVGK